jgi:hypothetical protein
VDLESYLFVGLSVDSGICVRRAGQGFRQGVVARIWGRFGIHYWRLYYRPDFDGSYLSDFLGGDHLSFFVADVRWHMPIRSFSLALPFFSLS